MNAVRRWVLRAGVVVAIGCLVLVAVSAQDHSTSLAYAPILDRDQVVAWVDAWNQQLPYVPGELLVKFKPGSEPAQQQAALSALRGGTSAMSAQWIGDVLRLRTPNEPNPEIAAAVLARQPEVQWAQPNYLVRSSAVPNDTLYNLQWNFDAINLPAAWDINPGSSAAVTVAVIDSGVTETNLTQGFPLWTGTQIQTFNIPFVQNPDIATSRFTKGRDFIFWNGPVLDMEGHGTHVAGTALEETNNALALAGIAYKAHLMPLKACVGYWELQILQSASGISGRVDPRSGTLCGTTTVTSAIRYAADNGAQIINMSLGGPDPSPAFLDALQYAVQHGVFVAIAAGNHFEEGNTTEYPAAYAPQIDGVMAVAAVNRSLQHAFYSNTGSYVEVAAPGGDERDGGLSGFIYQVAPNPPDFDPFTVTVPRFDRYANVAEQGTSMAAPHVAGVAALLYSQGIKNPAAIEAALKQFAKDLGPPGRDDQFGYGLIDARAAVRGLGIAR